MADPRYSLFAARAVFDPRLSATDVRVLAALGTFTDKQGWCVVKHDTVALKIGVARTTVHAAMKRIVDCGYAEQVHQSAPGRGRTSSKYRVKLDIEYPMSADTTSGPMSEIASSQLTSGGADVVPTQQQERTFPSKVVVVEDARAGATITREVLDGLKARAGEAANLTSGELHHGGVFRSLLAGGCEWSDIHDAIDSISASMIARKRQFHSWAIIREKACQNRDDRLAGVRAVAESPAKSARRFEAQESPSAVVHRLAKEGLI